MAVGLEILIYDKGQIQENYWMNRIGVGDILDDG